MLVDKLLEETNLSCEVFKGQLTEEQCKGNIENFIGSVPIPLGICGPIDIKGEFARGKFVVPMATEEGTLLASYSRGCKIMNECNGVETFIYGDYFLRAGQFMVNNLSDAKKLFAWCKEHEEEIEKSINESDRFIKVIEIGYDIIGTSIIVSLKLDTGDAMGSNMSSKAADVLADYIYKHNKDLIKQHIAPWPEDKKYIPSRQKGKKVVARVVLERETLTRIARVSLEMLDNFINSYKNLIALHGGYSLNVHVANGMAALFQALGQDIAYIGECSQAIVDSNFIDKNHLEVSLTLPSLIIGTVGAGTGLPAFRTTLSMIDCYGTGKSKKLAEIMTAVILAGEISCCCAQCAMEFVAAHETMGKNDPLKITK
jgi:hydroxymethylglutaryl-CoA reductase (NADPH)